MGKIQSSRTSRGNSGVGRNSAVLQGASRLAVLALFEHCAIPDRFKCCDASLSALWRSSWQTILTIASESYSCPLPT